MTSSSTDAMPYTMRNNRLELHTASAVSRWLKRSTRPVAFFISVFLHTIICESCGSDLRKSWNTFTCDSTRETLDACFRPLSAWVRLAVVKRSLYNLY